MSNSTSLQESDARTLHARQRPTSEGFAFFYLCGDSIPSRADNRPDHVPPKAIFAASDRDFPLRVAAHEGCNVPQSKQDEVIGQLIAVIHSRHPTPNYNRLRYKVLKTSGGDSPSLAVIGTKLVDQIWRWVRGFHAALYSEFLPENTRMAIHPPFPSGKLENDSLTVEGIKEQHYLFVETIKKNRASRCLDRIVCNNGKCIYECVWVQMDNGSWACIFALQIYNWIKLADKNFPARGCVGLYEPRSGRPTSGTKCTTLLFPFSNLELLDPFGK